MRPNLSSPIRRLKEWSNFDREFVCTGRPRSPAGSYGLVPPLPTAKGQRRRTPARRTASAALLLLLTALALATVWLQGVTSGHERAIDELGYLVLLMGLAFLLAAGLATHMRWALPGAITLGGIWCVAGVAWGVVLGGSTPVAPLPMLTGPEAWIVQALLTIPPTLILALLVPVALRLARRLEHVGAGGRLPRSDGPSADDGHRSVRRREGGRP